MGGIEETITDVRLYQDDHPYKLINITFSVRHPPAAVLSLLQQTYWAVTGRSSKLWSLRKNAPYYFLSEGEEHQQRVMDITIDGEVATLNNTSLLPGAEILRLYAFLERYTVIATVDIEPRQ